MLNIDVYSTRVVIRSQEPLTVGLAGGQAHFRFSDGWRKLTKTVIFRQGDVTIDVVGVTSGAVIPWEVLQEPGLPVQIGIYGSDSTDKIIIPTMWAETDPVQEAADPMVDASTDHTLPVYQQIQEQVDKNKPFIVQISGDDTTGYKADALLPQIHSARNAGRPIAAEYEGRMLPLVWIDSNIAEFCSVNGCWAHTAIVTHTDTRYGTWKGADSATVDKLSQRVDNHGDKIDSLQTACDRINRIVEPLDYQRFFDITKDGVVSLKQDYRGAGTSTYPESVGNGSLLEMPETLAIPDSVNGTQVTALAPGMFYGNKQVKAITLPATVTAIPDDCFCFATNLRAVNNTDHITQIGIRGFGATRLKKAYFPNLEEMGSFAFAACGYLETVDIGKINKIPENAFAECAFLREVLGGNQVSSIDTAAFYYTRRLKDLPLLSHVTTVGKRAFFYSRICTALPTGDSIHAQAFPTSDNGTDFWSGVTYKPCCNRITTKLSQKNPQWSGDILLTDDTGKSIPYNSACALFAVLHIHSAITGKYYSDPRDFVAELENRGLSDYLKYENWPGQFKNVKALFEALGYTAKSYGQEDGNDLTKDEYKALVKALSSGAYVYTQAGVAQNWEYNSFDGGHAVVLYGINELGEVYVLDSAVLHERFRDTGLEADADIYTYTIPYQNIVGPSSNFVIVYPPDVEPDTDEVTELQKTVSQHAIALDKQQTVLTEFGDWLHELDNQSNENNAAVSRLQESDQTLQNLIQSVDEKGTGEVSRLEGLIQDVDEELTERLDALEASGGGSGGSGAPGKDGVSCTHEWNGTVLSVTSASGTSSADLKGERGSAGVHVGSEEPTDPDVKLWLNPDGESTPSTNGGYYSPMISQPETGKMQIDWTASQSDMPSVTSKSISLPTGPQGDPGLPGVDGKSAYQYALDGGYAGSEADFAKKLAEDIPVATPDTLGGVKPVAKTDDMTQSVGVDDVGGLWASAPSAAGGKWVLIGDTTLEADSHYVLTKDLDGNVLDETEICVYATISAKTGDSNLSINDKMIIPYFFKTSANEGATAYCRITAYGSFLGYYAKANSSVSVNAMNLSGRIRSVKSHYGAMSAGSRIIVYSRR